METFQTKAEKFTYHGGECIRCNAWAASGRLELGVQAIKHSVSSSSLNLSRLEFGRLHGNRTNSHARPSSYWIPCLHLLDLLRILGTL